MNERRTGWQSVGLDCERKLVACLALMALLVGAPAESAETVAANVSKNGRAYEIEFEVFVAAPAERIRAVITDYSRLSELSPSVVHSRVLADKGAKRVRLELILRPCIWLLCRTLTKVTDVRPVAGGMEYVTDPQFSDFHVAREALVVTAIDGGSRVTYRGTLAPKFFVPPLIGSWLIRREILQDLKVTAQRVEERALR